MPCWISRGLGCGFTTWTSSRTGSLTLDALADLIRLTRNEVGHPTGRQIDEDTARVHLTIAPMYLRKMQQLAAYIASPPIGAEA